MSTFPDPKDDYSEVCSEIWEGIKEEKATLIGGAVFMIFVFAIAFLVACCVD